MTLEELSNIVTLLEAECINIHLRFDICGDGPFGVLCPYCSAAEQVRNLKVGYDMLDEAFQRKGPQ